MRILFTTTPGRGHWSPMLGFARAFADRGHEVHWAAYSEVCPELERKGFTASPAGLPEGATWAGLMADRPDIFDLPHAERPDHIFPGIFGARRAGPMLDELLPIAKAFQPDLLVCEQAEFAGPLVAKLLGVPNATHAFGRLIPEIRTRAAGDTVVPLWRANGLEPRPYGGMYDHVYVDIYPPPLQAAETDHLPEVQLVRPVSPPSRDLPTPPLPPGDAPLVYVTFGTVFNDTDLIALVVHALRGLDIRLVATVGPGNEPAELGDQPANVLVEQFIPQEALLPHCAVVVSHAGSGTFLAALAAGLPQVLLPQAADQFGNAEAAVSSRSGVVITPTEMSREAIADAVQQVLADDSFATAAGAIAGEIARMPSCEDGVIAFEERFAALS